ncbi:uncharacterized protein LOC113492333 isoform X2 [Trichoplusia ni]|uniref:Uncharacterized protein LOC113492333 isoform X2 n=1 Tax=Trichoplusia ni TaxID=7111 RepID=A0A7E5VBE0_TRINI|nr:uncharacterized protein LOC113492333 isoform X2 [Trichoplusia ni]
MRQGCKLREQIKSKRFNHVWLSGSFQCIIMGCVQGKPSRHASGRKNTPVKKVKLELPDSASSMRTSRQTFTPSSQSTPRSPNSAASSPGTRTPRRQPPRQSHQSRPPLRKITTPKPANPPHTYKKKRVTVVSATNKVKKNEVIVTRR